MDFTTTVLLSCFYVVLASHIWVQRERVSSIPSKVWQILSSWRNHFSCTDEVSKLEACVQQEMNETRVRNFQKVLAFGAPAHAAWVHCWARVAAMLGAAPGPAPRRACVHRQARVPTGPGSPPGPGPRRAQVHRWARVPYMLVVSDGFFYMYI